MNKKIMELGIEFLRIDNDINGNPRYVCLHTNLLTADENLNGIANQYGTAIQRAKGIGGKKYHNKRYKGGIVFQSHNLHRTAEQINELVKSTSERFFVKDVPAMTYRYQVWRRGENGSVDSCVSPCQTRDIAIKECERYNKNHSDKIHSPH